jgi:hypothetical protein
MLVTNGGQVNPWIPDGGIRLNVGQGYEVAAGHDESIYRVSVRALFKSNILA